MMNIIKMKMIIENGYLEFRFSSEHSHYTFLSVKRKIEIEIFFISLKFLIWNDDKHSFYNFVLKNQKLLINNCINITYSAFVKMQHSWNDNKMQVIPERVIFRFKHALTKNVISIFICDKKNRDWAFFVSLTISIWNYNRLSSNNFEKRFFKKTQKLLN